MRNKLLSGVALLAFAGSTTVQAELAPQASASPSAEAGAGSGAGRAGPAKLEEIVVTAQRVTQSSQKAAVPITVLGGAVIARANISTAAQLSQLAPALTVVSAGTYNFLFIRGVGNYSTTSFGDPAVAFNYDGVYVGRPTSIAGVFYDLDRVEVLKGPQGTLYGRNATGGAINVLPTQPVLGGAPFATSGSVSATYGNYNNYNVQGAVNVAVNDHTAVRIATNLVGHDGYLKDGTDSQSTQAVRVQVKTRLNADLTMRLDADYTHDGGSGSDYSYVSQFRYNPELTTLPLGLRFTVTPSNLNLDNGAFTPDAQAFREQAFAGPAGRTLDALLQRPFMKNDYYGVTGELDYNTPVGTLAILPSYRGANLNDLGGIGFYVRQREADNQESLEVRLAKAKVGFLDYNAGFYFFNEDISSTEGVDQSALANFQGYSTGTTSYAGFVRLTAHVTDKLRVVGGFRYTYDQKRFDGQQTSLTLICVARSCPTTPLFGEFGNLSEIPFAIPPFGVPVGGGPGPSTIISRNDNLVKDQSSFGEPTYRAALEYDVAPRSLLYGSVESGFRSGGFNLATGYETFKPEFITAYTVGVKNRFLEDRLQVNVEGFYWDYRDQQLPHIGIDLAGDQTYFTQNIGKATIKGGELEGRFLATPSTLLSVDAQYLDTRYSTFLYQSPTRSGPPFTSCAVSISSNPTLYNVNCAGEPAENSPKFTINLAAQQTFQIGETHKVVLEADTQYRTSYYDGFEYAPYEFVAANWHTNAYLTFAPSSDRWEITGFVRNIENTRTPTFGSNNAIANLAVVLPGAPRIYGFRLTAKF